MAGVTPPPESWPELFFAKGTTPQDLAVIAGDVLPSISSSTEGRQKAFRWWQAQYVFHSNAFEGVDADYGATLHLIDDAERADADAIVERRREATGTTPDSEQHDRLAPSRTIRDRPRKHSLPSLLSL